MCPALQNDVNLIRHLLVKETDDANVPFTIYLTKKQKMSLRRPLITLVLRVNPRMVEWHHFHFGLFLILSFIFYLFFKLLAFFYFKDFCLAPLLYIFLIKFPEWLSEDRSLLKVPTRSECLSFTLVLQPFFFLTKIQSKNKNPKFLMQSMEKSTLLNQSLFIIIFLRKKLFFKIIIFKSIVSVCYNF